MLVNDGETGNCAVEEEVGRPLGLEEEAAAAAVAAVPDLALPEASRGVVGCILADLRFLACAVTAAELEDLPNGSTTRLRAFLLLLRLLSK